MTGVQAQGWKERLIHFWSSLRRLLIYVILVLKGFEMTKIPVSFEIIDYFCLGGIWFL